MNPFEVRLDIRALSKDVRQDEWIAFLQERRWFSGKGRLVLSARPSGCCPVDSALSIVVLRVAYDSGDPEDYLLPLLVGTGEQSGAIAHFGGRPLLDALSFEEGWRRLLETFGRSTHVGENLSLRIELLHPITRQGRFQLGSADQTNSWAIVGDLFIKVYRRLQPGENLDVEVGRFLTLHGGARTPALRGVLTAVGDFGEATLLSLQGAVANQGTGWDLACRQVAQAVAGASPDMAPWATLGRELADLHRALAADGPGAIGTSLLQPPDLEATAKGVMALAREVLALLSDAHLPPAAAGLAAVLQHNATSLLRKIKAPLIPPGTCHRQRVHGDLHLGQVLWDGEAFTILDFEGEPARPMEERRRKQPPARDLAGMLRSFDYAARAGLPADAGPAGEDAADNWKRNARKAFRSAYEKAIGNEPFLPSDIGLRNKLVNLFELEKAFYELKYELGHRPDWVEIPLAGLLELVGPRRQDPPSSAF